MVIIPPKCCCYSDAKMGKLEWSAQSSPGNLAFDQYRAQFYARRGLEEHAAPPGIEQSDMFRIVRFRIGRSRIRPPARWSIARSVKGACIQYRQINVTSMQSW